MSGIFPAVRTWAAGQGQWARVVEAELKALRTAVNGLVARPAGGGATSAAVSSVSSRVNASLDLVEMSTPRARVVATTQDLAIYQTQQSDPVIYFKLAWDEDSGDPDNPIAHPTDITFTIGDVTTTLSSILDRLTALEP